MSSVSLCIVFLRPPPRTDRFRSAWRRERVMRRFIRRHPGRGCRTVCRNASSSHRRAGKAGPLLVQWREFQPKPVHALSSGTAAEAVGANAGTRGAEQGTSAVAVFEFHPDPAAGLYFKFTAVRLVVMTGSAFIQETIQRSLRDGHRQFLSSGDWSVDNGDGQFFPVHSGAAHGTARRELRYGARAARRFTGKRDHLHFARIKFKCLLPPAFRAGHLVKLRIVSEQWSDNC